VNNWVDTKSNHMLDLGHTINLLKPMSLHFNHGQTQMGQVWVKCVPTNPSAPH